MAHLAPNVRRRVLWTNFPAEEGHHTVAANEHRILGSQLFRDAKLVSLQYQGQTTPCQGVVVLLYALQNTQEKGK